MRKLCRGRACNAEKKKLLLSAYQIFARCVHGSCVSQGTCLPTEVRAMGHNDYPLADAVYRGKVAMDGKG